MKPLQILRIVAILEGSSFLLILFATMPLKYIWGMPKPTFVVGMAHGVLFIVYCSLVVLIGLYQKWSFKIMFWALLASVVPFGTFVADHKIFKPALVSNDDI